MGSACTESFNMHHVFLAFSLLPQGKEEGGDGVNPSGWGFPAGGFEPHHRGILEALVSWADAEQVKEPVLGGQQKSNKDREKRENGRQWGDCGPGGSFGSILDTRGGFRICPSQMVSTAWRLPLLRARIGRFVTAKECRGEDREKRKRGRGLRRMRNSVLKTEGKEKLNGKMQRAL